MSKEMKNDLKNKNEKGVLPMIFGILSVVMSGFGYLNGINGILYCLIGVIIGLVSVIFGAIYNKKNSKCNKTKIGMIFGIVGMILAVLVFCFIILQYNELASSGEIEISLINFEKNNIL